MKDDFNGKVLPTDTLEAIKAGVKSLLAGLGGDVDRASTAETPNRVARMYEELLVGYSQEPKDIIKSALFDVAYDEMVIVRDIDFYSLCEHHLMPFFGQAHVGYLPKRRVLGLSKVPRLVDAFARRLQVQERLTYDIANAVNEGVEARGVGVIISAQHLCAGMRGVQKPNAKMVTSAMIGAFRTKPETREEFMRNVGDFT